MSYDGREIANFILDTCKQANQPVTNLALQKILYFCHVWSLIDFDKPLIKHNFEAWQYGPVLQYVYREFKDFDRKPITTRALRINPNTGLKEKAQYQFDQDTSNLLKRVINFYGRLSAGQLVDLSHAPNGPWSKVWNHDEKIKPGMKIDNDDIKSFYSKVIPPYTIQ